MTSNHYNPLATANGLYLLAINHQVYAWLGILIDNFNLMLVITSRSEDQLMPATLHYYQDFDILEPSCDCD